MTLYERFFSVLNSSDMLLSVVGACTQIPSDFISPRGRRNHVSPHTRLTLVLFILIPKQITGIAIPLLHGVVVITSETATTLHMQDRVATICASNIVIFPTRRIQDQDDYNVSVSFQREGETERMLEDTVFWH